MSATILDFYRGQRILRPLSAYRSTVLRLNARKKPHEEPVNLLSTRLGQQPDDAA